MKKVTAEQILESKEMREIAAFAYYERGDMSSFISLILHDKFPVKLINVKTNSEARHE